MQRLWSLACLVYLPFYFAPWLYRPPQTLELIASLAAALLFTATYVDIVFVSRRVLLWQVLATGALSPLLASFNVGWCVYTIYAMFFASQLKPRRSALGVMGLLLGGLLVTGLVTHAPWYMWVWGIVAGGVTGLGGLVRSDLELRNRELAAAHEEVRALAVTSERERISRDLHDLLGQTLTLIAIKSDLATRLIPSNIEGARREMEAVTAAAREALSEVRAAVVGVGEINLHAEIERAVQILSAASVHTEINVETPPSDPRSAAVLAMALREAATNVARHAGASKCVIRLEEQSPGWIRLRVRDNGAGTHGTEGSGLRGMRARLAAVGGRLDFNSDRQGSELIAILPEKATA